MGLGSMVRDWAGIGREQVVSLSENNKKLFASIFFFFFFFGFGFGIGSLDYLYI